ncbi:MAG: hypothetical protein COW10_05420, partial [Candidatus Omnitrophica bacterium CG12_big_fil_rev_8_21_14_0_65_42_8]
YALRQVELSERPAGAVGEVKAALTPLRQGSGGQAGELSLAPVREAEQTGVGETGASLGADFNREFAAKARHSFGPEIMDIMDMNEDWQQFIETTRLELLKPFGASRFDWFCHPNLIYLQLTRRCIANCLHCSGNHGMHYKENMEPEIIQRVFAAFSELNGFSPELQLGGGEPFLTDVVGVLRLSPMKYVSVVTNGLTIKNPEHARKFVADLKSTYQAREAYLADYDDFGNKELSIQISIDDLHPKNLKKIFWFLDAIIEVYSTLNLTFRTFKGYETRVRQFVEFVNKQPGYRANLDEEKWEWPAFQSMALLEIERDGKKGVFPVYRDTGFYDSGRAFLNMDSSELDSDTSLFESYLKESTGGRVFVFADGRVGLEWGLPPPHVYWFGDLRRNTWKEILEQARNDPLFVALTHPWPRDVLTRDPIDFLQEYDTVLRDRLKENPSFWVLVKPERKIYITLRLLQEYLGKGSDYYGNFFLKQGETMPEFVAMSSLQLKQYVDALVAEQRKHYLAKLREKVPGASLNADSAPATGEAAKAKGTVPALATERVGAGFGNGPKDKDNKDKDGVVANTASREPPATAVEELKKRIEAALNNNDIAELLAIANDLASQHQRKSLYEFLQFLIQKIGAVTYTENLEKLIEILFRAQVVYKNGSLSYVLINAEAASRLLSQIPPRDARKSEPAMAVRLRLEALVRHIVIKGTVDSKYLKDALYAVMTFPGHLTSFVGESGYVMLDFDAVELRLKENESTVGYSPLATMGTIKVSLERAAEHPAGVKKAIWHELLHKASLSSGLDGAPIISVSKWKEVAKTAGFIGYIKKAPNGVLSLIRLDAINDDMDYKEFREIPYGSWVFQEDDGQKVIYASTKDISKTYNVNAEDVIEWKQFNLSMRESFGISIKTNVEIDDYRKKSPYEFVSEAGAEYLDDKGLTIERYPEIAALLQAELFGPDKFKQRRLDMEKARTVSPSPALSAGAAAGVNVLVLTDDVPAAQEQMRGVTSVNVTYKEIDGSLSQLSGLPAQAAGFDRVLMFFNNSGLADSVRLNLGGIEVVDISDEAQAAEFAKALATGA